MDNRQLLGLCLVCTLGGSILFGDWQSIGHDPCNHLNITTEQFNYDYLNSSIEGSGDITPNISHLMNDYCKDFSRSGHECFWNPQSRVTGEFCNTCATSCLSQQRSLDISQFSIGVLFLAVSAPLGFVFVSAISSEITSLKSQVAKK